MTDNRITRDELEALFPGGQIPWEVVELLFGPGNDNMTIGEVRDRIRMIAAIPIERDES